jgi:glycosyltransferase involved in cell wall biosynthesis
MSLSMIEVVRRYGLPAVFSIHNDWLLYGFKADQWTRIWPGRSALLRTAVDRAVGVPTRVNLSASGRLLFNSRFTLEQARRAGIDITDAEVISPGIERAFLDAVDEQPWQWRLLYAGRIDGHKGIDTAIDALGRLPAEARLTIRGKGHAQLAEELRAQAAHAGLAERVTFEPFGTSGDVRAAYAAADAVLFPVRWDEPWGLVPLEAMGIGRPVVSTARGGTTEFIRDGDNALVIAPDAPEELAAAVRRLAGDAALRARLRDGGRRTAAAHTADEFDRRTVDAIERAAGFTQ